MRDLRQFDKLYSICRLIVTPLFSILVLVETWYLYKMMHKIIAEYLRDKKDDLPRLYDWGFNIDRPFELFGIEVPGASDYHDAIELKKQLINLVEKLPEKKVPVADYFIKEWGGIKRFTKSSEVVLQFRDIEWSRNMPDGFGQSFKSISSWSKWLSIVCHEWACIYDARVAYSINAINYINGGAYKIFPSPDGRNTRLGILDVSTLLLAKKINKGDSSEPRKIDKAHFVSERNAYPLYVKLISDVSNELWGDGEHIHDVEMLLFALADKNIYQDLFDKMISERIY